jgi:hypothetical protein
MAERVGVHFGLLREVERINKQQIDRMIEKTRQALWVIRANESGCWASRSNRIPTMFASRPPLN